MSQPMISVHAPSHAPVLQSRPLSARLLIWLAEGLTRIDQNRRSRRALARLDSYMLKDIGITLEERDSECAKYL